MTISSTLNRTSLLGNDVTTTIPVVFPFHSASDLVVLIVIIATGVQTTQTITTQYTITGTPDALGHYSNGGAVEMVTAPATGELVVVYRDPARTQSLDLVENDNLPAESLEAQFDYLTMLIQRVEDRIGRSLRQPDGDSADIAVLPSKVDRALMFQAYDGNGDPIAAAGTSADLGPVSPFINTLLDDTDAATARVTLGISGDLPDDTHRVVGSSDATKKIAFEVDGLTPATTRTLTAQDRSGTLALIDEFAYANLAGSSGRIPLPAMYIQGLTYANNAGDATNDLDIAAGQCRDATNAHNILLSAITKRSDANWVVGTNQGALDTGAVGNSDYYIWTIKRSDTGVTDVLFSLSPTAPTMPTNYDFKRLIGWFKRVSGTIVAFTTYETEGGGLELLWRAPTLDVNLAATLTTTRRTDAVKVPLNFSTLASLNIAIDDATNSYHWVYCPDQTDAAPSDSVAPLASNDTVNVVSSVTATYRRIRTSATGTIAARSTVATVNNYRVSTMGFMWPRRN